MHRSIRSVHLLSFLPVLLFCFLSTPVLHAQEIGISDGFSFTADPADTTLTPFFPNSFAGAAGSNGFVETDGNGNLQFADGTPARFVGVSIGGTACFPDSAAAIVEARRLRKLGVNLVRFRYMDYSYDWATGVSILDVETGFRTLQPEQARRFDWFVYQLKENGIYSGLTLLSARAPRPEDGFAEGVLDTVPWRGQGMQYLYPEAREAHKQVAREFLDHVNQFTGTAYRDEAAIAFVELLHRRAMNTYHVLSWDAYEQAGAVFSWRMINRIDTLYNTWLAGKYGSTGNLADAWNIEEPAGGYPDLVQQGSFEGEFETKWTIGNTGAVSIFPILSQDSVPDGSYALTLRVSNSQGNIYNAYMRQSVDLEFNKLYVLTFRAKTDNPEGRVVRAAMLGEQGQLSPGFNQPVQVNPWWEEHELGMLMPVQNSAPALLYFFFGDANGNLSLDDIQLREVSSVGLVDGENLENYSVQRNVWGQNPTLSPARFADQARFYRDLDRNYLNDLYSFVRDTVKARQLIAGTENIWASTLNDVAAQRDMDLTLSGQGWDYVWNADDTWHVINYSPLRQQWAGTTYSHGVFAESRKPLITCFSTPFPNRYQAESMMHNPAYLLLQDWDGFIFDAWDENAANNRRDYIDSADWYAMRNNPVVSALMPSVSHMIRNGLLSPARTTIRLQRTREQMDLFNRFRSVWGAYGVPGGLSSLGMTVSRIVTDSLDASEFTQANDFEFESQAQGEVTSDTREIRWEYGRSLMSLNSPYLQAATGVLSQPGGLDLDFLEINAFSLNETATVLWVPLDSLQELDQPGRSLLTVITRAEPTGWQWADTTTASVWGGGPMRLDPAHLQLDFKPSGNVKDVLVFPLNEKGQRPDGVPPLPVTRSGNDFRVTIDQSVAKAVWYSVEFIPAGSSVNENVVQNNRFSFEVLPNVIGEKGTVFLSSRMPGVPVQLELTDALGRHVRSLFSGTVPGGEQRIDFITEDLAAGVYFVRGEADGRQLVQEVRVVR